MDFYVSTRSWIGNSHKTVAAHIILEALSLNWLPKGGKAETTRRMDAVLEHRMGKKQWIYATELEVS